MRAISKELALGQVRAALRPTLLDPVEVREVLLGLLSMGHDAAALYLEATMNRPQEYQPPPPLTKVLPLSLLLELERSREDLELESDPESDPEG